MGENKETLQKFARLAREQVDKTVRENIRAIEQRNMRENEIKHGCPDCPAARCVTTCPRYLTHYASRAEFWDWWGRTSPPDRREKEAVQHIPAPPAKRGGGSKSKRKRKKQYQDLRRWVVG